MMLFSKQKLLIAGALGLAFILIGVLVTLFGTSSGPTSSAPPIPPAKLTVWGVFDDTDALAPLLGTFHERFGHLEAEYKKLTIEEYESTLLNALAAGKGPDVYMVNNTWMPRYQERLTPAPAGSLTAKDFRDAFVDGAAEDLIVNEQVYGVPLHMDTLALFYNKEHLASAGIALPPKTWEEFLADVKLLTKRDDRGNILRAGAALGTAKNVNRSFDILSLLMLQQGAQMVTPERTRATFDEALELGRESFFPGQRALQFYTDFANPRKAVYTWNTLQHFSTDAFIAGEASMTINYARIIPLIESRAPYMKWGVAPVPQISSRDLDVNFGNYWAFAVSATTKHPNQSWQFLRYITERDQAKRYADATLRPVVRKDLVDIQRTDEKLGVFAVQSLSAKTWYQVDNRAIEELFAEMVESVVKGSDSVKDAIAKAAKQVAILMRKY